MKFLDSNGLTYFWNKIKTWAGNNYLSLKGGEVDGSITTNIGFVAKDPDTEVSAQLSPGTCLSIYNHKDTTPVLKASFDENGVYAPSFRKTNGTSTQALIADGSVKGIGSANGIAGLDSKGNVPLSQLGNLDTTVAEVVTALPTTNIKKHIYLIKDTGGVTQNQYEEYIYTGNTSATYDASKWEKLGDFRATVDLKDYAKKNEAINSIDVDTSPNGVDFEYKDINGNRLGFISIERATATVAGVMTSEDRKKLNGIANNANNYSLPTASSTIKGGITLGYQQSGKNYPVAIDNNGKAYVNVPWTDTNTTYSLATSTKDGLMKASDKAKLDGIANNATADSAITTAEIDALFT